MSAREEILRRLGRREGPSPLPALPQATRPAGDLTSHFVERASAAGAEVEMIEPVALAASATRIVRAAQPCPVVAWHDPVLMPVVDALRAAGISVVLPGDQTREITAGAAVGITTADYGIAETGTLVLAGGPGRPRAVSLLPLRHIAVLPAERICTDLFDLVPRLVDPPSTLTFITGPSRTADIELTQVRGVHGPVAVTILVLASPRSP